MKRFLGDFHVHTGLSPCADDEMTPNNIIRMAKLNGWDFLAIADHHSVENFRACQLVGRLWNITCFCGMELETREGVHVLGLFPSEAVGRTMEDWVTQHLKAIDNRPEVFGNQWIFDSDDERLCQRTPLLAQSLTEPFESVVEKLHEIDALAIPAHVERRSHGLLGQLGVYPPGVDVDAIEVGQSASLSELKEARWGLPDVPMIRGSDAHWLAAMVSPYRTEVEVEELIFPELVRAFRQKDGRRVMVAKER